MQPYLDDLAVKYITVSYTHLSGSSANLIAFMTLTAPELGDRQIRKGDEIITVACGFPTTVTPAIQYLSLIHISRIDGASEAKTFVRIALPMIKPGIGALAIFTFINSWNDYFMQLIMLSSTSNLTISLGIAKLQAENSTDFGLIMAGAALAAVPIIIIFLIFQKYFTKGIAMGAVKG